MDTQANNKRIAKNTIALYFRMFLMMGISLYTSRVILQTLGVEDYGIYNVVGGLVSMFGLINSSMTTATQRFITIAIGKKNMDILKKVFSISIQIHVIIGIVTILLIESVGLWFLYNKMQLPIERINAAFWVLQFSTITFFISIISVPYNAAIIAHEKMSAFAYISIIEVLLKLVIVFLLLIISFDKLIIYAILLALVQISVRIIYSIYCRKHFEETHYSYYKDILLMKEMAQFAGWNMFGGLSNIAFGQGLSMMLNVFFGPVVNAARAIAQQVQGAIQMFITNFQMALNPQIVKYYASDQLCEMHNLMERSSRFSYYLMLLLSLPVFFETHFILQLWLGVVPDNTVIFLRLIIATTLIYTIINPILAAINATGNVRTYYIICGCILISILPISYVVLSLGAPAYSVFVVHFFIELITQCVRLLIVRSKIKLSIRQYVKRVYFRIFLVTIVSVSITYLSWNRLDESFFRFFFVSFVSVISVVLSAYLLGLNSGEKLFFLNKFKSLLIRK